jgi:hypothetical protein
MLLKFSALNTAAARQVFRIRGEFLKVNINLVFSSLGLMFVVHILHPVYASVFTPFIENIKARRPKL